MTETQPKRPAAEFDLEALRLAFSTFRAEAQVAIGNVRRELQRVGKRYRRWEEEHRTEVQSFLRELSELAPRLVEAAVRIDRDAAWLLDQGWGVPATAPVPFASEVRRFVTSQPLEDQQRLLREIMLGSVTPEVLRDGVSSGWTGSRYQIDRQARMKEVVAAYELGLYFPALCGCMTQFEGLLVDEFGLTGRVTWRDVREKIAALPASRWFPSQSEALLQGLLLQRVLGGFQIGGDAVDELNRHATLHGADVAEVTQERVLRAILAVETLRYTLPRLTRDASTAAET